MNGKITLETTTDLAVKLLKRKPETNEMQLSPLTFLGILALIWAINQIIKEYLISRKLRQDYQRKLKAVLTDPNAQPKGRFE